MKKWLNMGHRKRSGKELAMNLIFILAVTGFLGIGSVAVYNIFVIQDEYGTAVDEYEDIREEIESDQELSADTGQFTESAIALAEIPDLSHLNPDYAGWIVIEDTKVDYPIVQGSDNDKYLTTTFKGTINTSGTIFMDTYCTDGFDGTLTILYGHNMRNGSMFGGLRQYGDRKYREEHPEVIVGTADQQRLVYQVFSAKTTSGDDPVYFLPDAGQSAMEEYFASYQLEDGAHILVLSTCTNRNTVEDERLLVFAVRY